MKKAIIVDLDGTLANIDHRLHLVKGQKKNWDLFFEQMNLDLVNPWCYMILQGLFSSDKFYAEKAGLSNPSGPWRHHFLIVSGRPNKYMHQTQNWLNENKIPTDQIFLRPDDDHRADHIIKKEIYNKHIKHYYKVLFVLDDRKSVVDMWRKEGLVCLQCAKGEF